MINYITSNQKDLLKHKLEINTIDDTMSLSEASELIKLLKSDFDPILLLTKSEPKKYELNLKEKIEKEFDDTRVKIEFIGYSRVCGCANNFPTFKHIIKYENDFSGGAIVKYIYVIDDKNDYHFTSDAKKLLYYSSIYSEATYIEKLQKEIVSIYDNEINDKSTILINKNYSFFND